MPIELSVQQRDLQRIAKELKGQADGKRLRRELAKDLRGELDPAVSAIRAGVMAIPTAGEQAAEGPGLRSAVARKIKAQATLTGRRTGAKMVAGRTQEVRGFRHAPKRLQSRKGWTHPVYGRGSVRQIGNPGYFDDPIRDRRAQYRRAVLDVIERWAKRLARKGQ